MIKEDVKLTLLLIAAMLVLITGCGLIIASFLVPPLGIIDSSVLVAYGETLSFVGAILGIDYHYRYMRYKGE